MRRAVVLQQTPTEEPERVAQLLAERGLECETRHVYGGDRVPTELAPGEPLVVMGGPMGVGDAGDPRYPFLAAEIALLRTLVPRDHPILGICLGSQLLAAGAGARVYPNERREVGWGPVDFIGVEREPALAGLGPREQMLHWHGDTFDLPAGAVLLASTPVCRHQAFRLGTRQFGLQFHCELGPETIAIWVRDDADYVRGANGDGGGAQILADTARYFAAARPVWDRLLRNVVDVMLESSQPTMANELKLGLIQMRCSTDPGENLARAEVRVRAAARDGAQVICLPELFRTPYFCQTEDHANFDLAEPIPGPTTQALAAAARDAKVVVIGSVFERRAAGVYHNTAVVLDADGRVAGIYRKMHIPDDPRYYEKFYFAPGDLGFRAFDTAFGRIGALVCWDQWYPEAARLTTLAGADVLFYPTAIGWHPAEKAEHGAAQAAAWQTVQRAHAISNGVYVAAVNRVGHERAQGAGPDDPGIEFWGGSFVVDPFGAVLAEASRAGEDTLIVSCDRRHQERVRQHWPFLRDRRIDAYGAITRRFDD